MCVKENVPSAECIIRLLNCERVRESYRRTRTAAHINLIITRNMRTAVLRIDSSHFSNRFVCTQRKKVFAFASHAVAVFPPPFSHPDASAHLLSKVAQLSTLYSGIFHRKRLGRKINPRKIFFSSQTPSHESRR